MPTTIASKSKPKIVMSDADHARLSQLAEGLLERLPAASELLAEVERATVLPADALPATVVRMGSTIEYATEDNAVHRVRLVYPDEADIAKAQISILTPVGAALIGLSKGQSISWTTLDNRERRLNVLSVS
jgi:regulator of nucleoside diphosphate kinase